MNTRYGDMTKAQLTEELEVQKKEYERIKSLGLKLDMSRGKPNPSQLDLSNGMLGVLKDGSDCIASDGTDTRNYGVMSGIPEARKLFAELLGVKAGNVIIGGNSSLTMMYDTFVRLYLFGAYRGSTPWGKQDKIKFLCPAPGYDRHFAICQDLGAEMITVPMTDEGPDMDIVESLCRDDVSVKGMWCVPKYSNPGGVTYSEKTVHRIASLRHAADDFRIFWDNAYIVHDLYEEKDELVNIFDLTDGTDNEDMVYEFASTSKMTFPGDGIAVMAASTANIEYTNSHITYQTISYDKVNQLRHVKYFGSVDGIKEHMKKQAEILAPKFIAVDEAFEKNLGSLGIAEWSKPKGGYFVSLDVPDGCAKRVYALCSSLGVKLTNAGATFPYGVDKRDRNLRIAPSYPSPEEMKEAIAVLCVCVKIAALEKLLAL